MAVCVAEALHTIPSVELQRWASARFITPATPRTLMPQMVDRWGRRGT